MDTVRFPLLSVLTIGLLPSFLKKFFYRLKGYSIGRHVVFSLGSVVMANNTCRIASWSTFGFLSIIKAENVEIGYGCKIRSLSFMSAYTIRLGDDVCVSETAIIRASHPSNKSIFVAEDRVHIFPHTIIDPSYPVLLGEECAVGFYSNIYTHGSYKNVLDGYRVIYAAVNIGKRVELAYNVFVAPGVSIGDDAIIAFGAYVNNDIPGGVLAAGMPAQVKRTKDQFAPPLTEKEKIELIISIIKGFCDHITSVDQYFLLSSDKCHQDYVWSFVKRKVRFKLFLCLDEDLPAAPEANDIVVLYDSSKEGSSYTHLGCQYFDVLRYQCPRELKKNGRFLKEYFERYGIRFRVNYLG